MPNPQYKKGYRMERKCRKELEKAGYSTYRSGGSKTPVEVIAVDLNTVRLIQIKSGKDKRLNYRSDENIQRLMDLQVPTNCSKEIWIWRDRKGWHKERLNSYV